jgi:glycosyltransferase involved in cell wall biosynthesis
MMNDFPLVSVIMPSYNAADYIVESIESVLGQTYQNLELIVIDDCSTDDTYSICLELARKDRRLRVFRNDINMKISHSLNRAISIASGEYVARMDADDICLPHRIASQLAFLRKHDEFMMVGSSVEIIDNRGQSLSAQIMPGYPQCMRALRFGSTIAHPTWFARKAFFADVGDYRISGVEDYDYLLRASSMGMKMSCLPEVLLKYRVSDTNSSHQYGLKQIKLVSYVQAINQVGGSPGKRRHDEQSIEKHVSYSKLAARLYGVSQLFFDRAYSSKAPLRKALNFAIAAAVSPYGALRLYRALAWKIVTR